MWLRVLASGVAQVSMAPSPAGAAKAAVPYVCIAVSCRWTEVMRITGLEDLQSLAWGVSWAEPRPCPQRPGPVPSSPYLSLSRGLRCIRSFSHRSAPTTSDPIRHLLSQDHHRNLWAEVREGWGAVGVRQEIDVF